MPKLLTRSSYLMVCTILFLIGIVVLYFINKITIDNSIYQIKIEKSPRIYNQEPLMQLDVITSFPILLDSDFKHKELLNNNKRQNNDRMKEYLTCLKRTLGHRYVSKVHLLYDQRVMSSFINSHVGKSFRDKLVLKEVGDALKSLVPFDYAFSHLQDRLVMVKQGDTYLGDGFDLVNKRMMVEKRLAYALTRKAQLEENCDMRNLEKYYTSNTCSEENYSGSHDGYIFVPQGKLTAQTINLLKDKDMNALGIDNVIVWVLKNVFKYKVMNPCKIISLFHYHCSTVHNNHQKPRVNEDEISAIAKPTDKLS